MDLGRSVAGRRDQVRRPIRRFDRREIGQQPEDPACPAHRGTLACDPPSQCADRDPVLTGQRDVAEGRRGALGEQELGRLAGRHGCRGVDEQGDGDVLLLHEELDEQSLQPRIDVPVELPKVVARRVVAVVGEFHGLTAFDTPATALEAAADRRAHQQEQAFELAQERLVEDRGIDLAWEEGLARAGTRRCQGIVHGHVAAVASAAIRWSARRPRRGWLR